MINVFDQLQDEVLELRSPNLDDYFPRMAAEVKGVLSALDRVYHADPDPVAPLPPIKPDSAVILVNP